MMQTSDRRFQKPRQRERLLQRGPCRGIYKINGVRSLRFCQMGLTDRPSPDLLKREAAILLGEALTR